MSRSPTFTKAQVRRAVQAAESAGIRVTSFTINPDGSITVDGGESSSVPVDSRKKDFAASWDDA